MKFCIGAGDEKLLDDNVYECAKNIVVDGDGNVISWRLGTCGSIAQNGPQHGCLLFKELLYTKVDDALSWKSLQEGSITMFCWHSRLKVT